MNLTRVIVSWIIWLSALLTVVEAAEPWYYNQIRSKFVRIAVSHRKPEVPESEAQEVAQKIINMALKAPQVEPVLKEVSTDVMFGGTNLSPSSILKITKMTYNAYMDMRKNPGFNNYLMYIKQNYNKFDFNDKNVNTSANKDKAKGYYDRLESNPQGKEAIEIGKKLGMQIVNDAKIPISALPPSLQPPGGAGGAGGSGSAGSGSAGSGSAGSGSAGSGSAGSGSAGSGGTGSTDGAGSGSGADPSQAAPAAASSEPAPSSEAASASENPSSSEMSSEPTRDSSEPVTTSPETESTYIQSSIQTPSASDANTITETVTVTVADSNNDSMAPQAAATQAAYTGGCPSVVTVVDTVYSINVHYATG